MSHQTKSTDLAAVVKELRRYLLEKGHRFERGPAYESQTKALSDVAHTVRMYEGMGYTKFMQMGDPPVYTMLGRGHQEMHIFQPQDPKVQAWLEDDQAALNDPAMRQYMLQASGLTESDLPVASKPKNFRITEVDGIFIITSEEAPPERR